MRPSPYGNKDLRKQAVGLGPVAPPADGPADPCHMYKSMNKKQCVFNFGAGVAAAATACAFPTGMANLPEPGGPRAPIHCSLKSLLD